MFGPIEQFYRSYDIGAELGRGAFAICYKATNKTTGQSVAVKKINLGGHSELPENIVNQIEVLKKLDHPRLIRFIAAYVSKKDALIVTDYQEGRDLQQLIAFHKKINKRFTDEEIWSIFKQLLEGIAYLHANNIIHRDIKPSNIFVSPQLEIKIGDLGASKLVDEQNYTRIGTPFYLPPQIIRHESYSFPADIWSLGVTIYHLFYLDLPFKASNIIRLGQLIVESQPNFKDDSGERLIESVIRVMLNKNQKNRQSASVLLDQYCKLKQNVNPARKDTQTKSNSEIVFDDPGSIDFFGPVAADEEEQCNLQNVNQQQHGQIYQKVDNNRVTENQSSYGLQTFINQKDIKNSNRLRSSYLSLAKSHLSLNNTFLSQNENTIILTVDYSSNGLKDSTSQRILQRHSNVILQPFQTPPSTKIQTKKSSGFRGNLSSSIINAKSYLQCKSRIQNQLKKHKRQESGIQTKQKHSELMLKLKPLKVQNFSRMKDVIAKSQSNQRPQIKMQMPVFIILR